jgi:hypothetical protein
MSFRCAGWWRIGTRASEGGALAPISVGGQDRATCATDALEYLQRGIENICYFPRALNLAYEKRGGCPRKLMTSECSTQTKPKVFTGGVT